jgi:hypothetical protein
MERREFLAHLARGAFAGWLLGPTDLLARDARAGEAAGAPAQRARRVICSPEQRVAGRPSSLGVLDLDTNATSSIATPVLGHSVVGHPRERRRVILFGQRPEKRSCVVDLVDQEVVQAFEATPGRHFYGHGAFSVDGRFLYATETADDTGAGVITVRDAKSLAVLSELPSHGAAPHEMAFASDGRTLVIANGGAISIEGGAYGRVEQPEPALCRVDSFSGKLLERHTLEDGALSLRHIYVTRSDDVVVAIKRYPSPLPSPCIALQRAGSGLEVLPHPEEMLDRFRSLALSVVVAPSRQTIAATHPDGNLVSFWSLDEGRLLSTLDVPAPEGVALAGDGRHLVVTTAAGRAVLVDTETRAPAAAADVGSRPGLNWKHSVLWTV